MAEYQRARASNGADDPIAQQILQNMLADRCKLVPHRVPVEMPAFAIEVARNGPKLTPAATDEAQPSGSVRALGGGFFTPPYFGDRSHTNFYAVSMDTFVDQLRDMAHVPVVDRTGLTGKYDFTLTWLSLGPHDHEDYASPGDPFPLSHWNFSSFGLKVERIQIPAEHIVIDHIEKPSEN